MTRATSSPADLLMQQGGRRAGWAGAVQRWACMPVLAAPNILLYAGWHGSAPKPSTLQPPMRHPGTNDPTHPLVPAARTAVQKDLTNSLSATSYIPGFSGEAPFTLFRGQPVIDGARQRWLLPPASAGVPGGRRRTAR